MVTYNVAGVQVQQAGNDGFHVAAGHGKPRKGLTLLRFGAM
jgi:hypothetical protein